MSRQAIVGGPLPVFTCETGARQAITGGLTFINETASSSQTILLGQALETDSALPVLIIGALTIPIGQALETDSALALTVINGGSFTQFLIDEYDMGASNEGLTFQRDVGGFNRVVTFTGTYIGAAGIRAKVRLDRVGGGTQLALTEITGLVLTPGSPNRWSGTAIVPEGDINNGVGAYWTAYVQDYYDGAVNGTQARPWTVGICEHCCGQSGIERMLSQTSAVVYAAQDSATRITNGGGYWRLSKNLDGTNATNGGNGRGWVAYVASLRALGETAPICLILNAINNSTLKDYVPTSDAQWVAIASSFNSSLRAEYERVKWYEGGTAAEVGSPNPLGPTYVYDNDLPSLAGQFATHCGRALALPIAGVSQGLVFGVEITGATISNPAGTKWDDGFMNSVRHSHFLQSRRTGCYLLGSAEDNIHNPSDQQHASPEQYSTQQGPRWALATAFVYGRAALPADGPYISRASKTAGSNLIKVFVTHLSGGSSLRDGTGNAAGTGLAGWVVNVNGTPDTISATAFVSGHIELTIGTTLAGGETVTVTYGDGANPWGWPFPVNALSTDADHIVYDNNGPSSGGAYVGTGLLGPISTKGLPLLPTYASNGGAITANEASLSAGNDNGGLLFLGVG